VYAVHIIPYIYYDEWLLQEALRCYCREFMLEFNKFIEENADVQTEDNTQNEKETAS
jgi:hypothetical protein